MTKYSSISSYIRKPFLIYDFPVAPIWISLYMRKFYLFFISASPRRDLCNVNCISPRPISSEPCGKTFFGWEKCGTCVRVGLMQNICAAFGAQGWRSYSTTSFSLSSVSTSCRICDTCKNLAKIYKNYIMKCFLFSQMPKGSSSLQKQGLFHSWFLRCLA